LSSGPGGLGRQIRPEIRVDAGRGRQPSSSQGGGEPSEEASMWKVNSKTEGAVLVGRGVSRGQGRSSGDRWEVAAHEIQTSIRPPPKNVRHSGGGARWNPCSHPNIGGRPTPARRSIKLERRVPPKPPNHWRSVTCQGHKYPNLTAKVKHAANTHRNPFYVCFVFFFFYSFGSAVQ